MNGIFGYIWELRKAYEHVAQITSRLTGAKPMRIPAEAEEMCRLMFIAVQPVFVVGEINPIILYSESLQNYIFFSEN